VFNLKFLQKKKIIAIINTLIMVFFIAAEQSQNPLSLSPLPNKKKLT